VHALYQLLQTGGSTHQECIYIEGVGTQSGGLFDSAFNFLGGAFGSSLDDNILEGYRWLVENYEENDQIFLFGFSRGAYSARSLAGLIRNSGVLHREHSSYLRRHTSFIAMTCIPTLNRPRSFANDFYLSAIFGSSAFGTPWEASEFQLTVWTCLASTTITGFMTRN
jgi:acetyl esterase/lipase